MSPAAAALQFPALDSADAEWSEEQEELAVANAIDNKARRLEALKNGLRIGRPDGSPTSLSALKAEVAMVVAGGRDAGPAWPTGVAELDVALGGGVPRGRVTEVVGPLGAGKTSLVRQLVARVLTDGGWVAWVDATRTLAPQELAGLGERLIIVRPHDHTRGAWCADLLLRSGVFALVVLDGAPVLSRTVGVRLSQLARERDAAFVVMREGTQSSRLGGAVRLQVRPVKQMKTAIKLPAKTTRKFSVLVEKGGLYRTVEVTCAIVVARRVCADTEIPDRRGVARRAGAAGGVEQKYASDNVGEFIAEQSISAPSVGKQSGDAFVNDAVINESVIAPSINPVVATGSRHAVDAGVTRKHISDPWKGRGRARMAESSYGRLTRRGKARKFLSSRDHAQKHDGGYERKQRAAEGDASIDKHTHKPNRQQERRDSRRQSRRELNQYAGSG